LIGSGSNRDQIEDFGFNPILFRDPYNAVPVNPQRSQYLAIRFRRGNESAKTLKEFKGTLSLPFRIEGELLNIDKPVEAAGKTARSGIGASLNLASVKRSDSGELKMELSVDLPNEVMPSRFNLLQFAGNAKFQAGMFGGAQQITTKQKHLNNSGEYMGISLLDANDKTIALKMVRDETVSMSGDGMKIKMLLIAKLANDAPEPARLVFRALYATSVEVPFAFHDLTLQ
jgi:hypothetical protein